eukprot:TRINITY_DN8385_c0_g1_i1.p1 TRINITY_DN8385_c0_g1~~TRINITY_DN8385_c0_g1_i1.p1  ORF type:complete len:359 (-),score=71.14 TRINITY_DN8385_c0_g1_i1:471-1547(-)
MALTESAGNSEHQVAVLLCILHVEGKFPKSQKIWRRIAVPADFSLLELHVALQNAFDWENSHLHNFQQPRKPSLSEIPSFGGFGRTAIANISTVDVDSMNEDDIRTFQSVIGIKDGAGAGLLLTPVQAKEGKADAPAIVYVQHSHPHGIDPSTDEKSFAFTSSPKQVLEERSFIVKDLLNAESPVLVYEYNFSLSHEVTIYFQGQFETTEGVNYPTCLAGEGESRAEDGDDMDDEGNLLPTYDFENFSVMQVADNFEQTYDGSWPLGPGSEEKALAARCYMCKYNRECGRRSKCSGSCCDYCIKSHVAVEAASLPLPEADSAYATAMRRIVEARRIWVEKGTCSWTEVNGEPCTECSD